MSAPELPADPNEEDEAPARERKRSARIREKQRAEFLAHMLADSGGRDWLAWLLNDVCSVWSERLRLSPSSGHTDRPATDFQRGQREVGLQILHALLCEHPQLTAEMIAEHAR